MYSICKFRTYLCTKTILNKEKIDVIRKYLSSNYIKGLLETHVQRRNEYRILYKPSKNNSMVYNCSLPPID